MTILFRLTPSSLEVREKKYAGATVMRSPVPDGSCLACGRERKTYRQAQHSEAGASGATVWPKVMCSSTDLLFDERTIEIFDEEGLTGFTPYPVSFEKITSKALRLQPTPMYYLLGVEGGVKFDPVASGAKCLDGYCDECSGTAVYDGLKRFVLRMDTYNGTDFFRFINHAADHLFCSLRTIEVFRKHKIDNLQVRPLDICWRDYGVSAIDYLGPIWPPKSWYPPLRSAGRTQEEWWHKLIETEIDGVYSPLMDFLPAIGADLIKATEQDNELVRWNALRALKEAHEVEGFDVPQHLLDQGEPLTYMPPVSVLRSRLFTGNKNDRETAGHYLTQLREEKRIELSDREREAILKLLPHMPPSALD